MLTKKAQSPAMMPATPRERLLLVGDDATTLYALRSLFERHGWDVSGARSVAEAVAMLDPSPDWIIINLRLSDGDGGEILRKVRDLGLDSRVAIICGPMDHERVSGLRPWEPDLVIPKPIDVNALLRACAGG
ncbi:response regulator, partial [Singulisphaera rosea]